MPGKSAKVELRYLGHVVFRSLLLGDPVDSTVVARLPCFILPFSIIGTPLVLHRLHHWRSALALILLLVAAALSSGADYTFTNITDSTGPYRAFPTAFPTGDATYPLNDTGTVAFVADLDAGGQGVFVGGNPARDTVADSTDPYASFGEVAINNRGTVAFRASLDAGGDGIFTGPNPTADTVVDTNGPYGILLGAALNDNDQVVFSARLDTGAEGIFTGPDPATDTLIDTGGPYSKFTSVAINNNETVAFRAGLDVGGEGIFTGPDPLTDTVADTFGDFFSLASPAINDLGTVVFEATLLIGGAGIFVGPNPATDTVADTFGPYAKLGPPAINNAGTVAFWAKLDAGGEGIFTGPDPVADKVIATGDRLFGQTVTDLFFATGLSQAGQIAFRYEFDTGVTGIAVAGFPLLLGDVNWDGQVNGLDVDPFVDVLLSGPYQREADMNQDAVVNGLDVDPFVATVVGNGASPAGMLASVPEPTTTALCVIGLICVAGCNLAAGSSVIRKPPGFSWQTTLGPRLTATQSEAAATGR